MENLLFSYADPTQPAVKRKLIQLIEGATGQRKLKRIYLDHRQGSAGESFWSSAIRRLAIDVRVDWAALDRIPKTGPVVVVANHPYGVLDGIAIAWLVERSRPDFLILTHAALLRAPEARTHLLAIDFSETPEALQTNIESRARARQHLEAGGCLVVFPAGAVSTAPDRLGRLPAIDALWRPFTAQLIQRAKATVVPVYFDGQNSRVFQIASHLSQTLRLSLIFHEVKKRIGTALPVVVGEPIGFDELDGIKDRHTLVEHLMARTYALKRLLPEQPSQRRFAGRLAAVATDQLREKARRIRTLARRGRRSAQPRPR